MAKPLAGIRVIELANFIAGPHNAWPELREAQLQTLALKNTGMAVALDQGTLVAAGLREGLERILTAYGMLTLSEETVRMTQLVAPSESASI